MSVNEDHLTTGEIGVPRYSTANKAGFVLAILLGASGLVGLASPTPDGEVGPPWGVLIFGAVTGIAIVACVLIGWLRGSKAAIRAAVILLVLTAITALPAFVTPDVPAPLVASAGIFVVLTIVALVLMLKPSRQ